MSSPEFKLFFSFFSYCILDDKTCSETHLVLGKVQFVLNDMRRVREKKQGVSSWDKSKTRGNGWCFVEHVFFQTGAEVMELFHAAVMDVASPIFFWNSVPNAVALNSSELSSSFAHRGSFFVWGWRPKEAPFLLHASHPCYGCNRKTVRYFEMPLATRKPRRSPSHWFGELKPDTITTQSQAAQHAIWVKIH